jgi:hypothetical protein
LGSGLSGGLSGELRDILNSGILGDILTGRLGIERSLEAG